METTLICAIALGCFAGTLQPLYITPPRYNRVHSPFEFILHAASAQGHATVGAGPGMARGSCGPFARRCPTRRQDCTRQKRSKTSRDADARGAGRLLGGHKTEQTSESRVQSRAIGMWSPSPLTVPICPPSPCDSGNPLHRVLRRSLPPLVRLTASVRSFSSLPSYLLPPFSGDKLHARWAGAKNLVTNNTK